MTGTIDDLYILKVAALATGGTITRNWFIYAPDTVAKSYIGGYVGIGQGTYANITSRITLPAAGTTVADGISWGDSANLYRSAANTLKTDGSLIVTGNVGINMVPTFKLDIAGSNMRINNGSTNYTLFDIVANSQTFRVGKEGTTPQSIMTGSLAGAGVLNVIDASALQLGTNNTAKVTILSDGNVGIGTTTPGARLHIADNNNGTKLSITGTESSHMGGVNYLMALIDGSSITHWSVGGSMYGLKIIGPNTVNNGAPYTSNYALYVQAGTTDVPATNPSYAAVFMNGNVGIGTASPGAKLDVRGFLSVTDTTSAPIKLSVTTANGTFWLRDDSDSSVELSLRANIGNPAWIAFTENSVGDRWLAGIKPGDGSFYFATGSPGS
jgi:hypothetical protein